MVSERIRKVAEWLWSNDTENLYTGSRSVNHWDNLSEDRRTWWYDKAELMLEFTDMNAEFSRAREEIDFWKTKFSQTVNLLRNTHVNVYPFTLGLEPSPYERDHARELLKEHNEPRV